MALAIADTPLPGQSNSGAGSTLSFNYANTTGDCMCIFASINNAHTLNTPTWNGSATGVTLVTNLLTDVGNANSFRIYAWILMSPTTGTHAVAFAESSGATANIDAAVICFSGSNTSTQPDNSSNTGRTTTGSTFDATGTTVTNGAWPIAIVSQNGAAVGAGSGATREAYTSGTGETGIFDNAAALGTAGSFTIHTTISAAATGFISFAIRPAGGGGGATTWGPWLLSPNWNRIVQG